MNEIAKKVRDRRLRALGKAISTRRETLGLSQRALAEEVGTSQNAVYEWEAGKVAPGADKVWALADILETTASELFATAEDSDTELDEE